MSDWKTQHGVSDQGASNAGIYGKPQSTYDIGRAKAESDKLLYDSVFRAPDVPSYPIPTYAKEKPTYWEVKLIGVLVLIGLIIFLISTSDVWITKYKDHVTSLDADKVMSLDTAYYEKLSPEAAKMSVQSTAQLYGSEFPDEVMGRQEMSYYGSEKLAVHAVWIRYTKD